MKKQSKPPVLTAKDRADQRSNLLPLTREISKLTRAVNELKKTVAKMERHHDVLTIPGAALSDALSRYYNATGTGVIPDSIVKDKPTD